MWFVALFWAYLVFWCENPTTFMLQALKSPKSWMRWNLWMKCWKETLPDTNKSQNHCLFCCRGIGGVGYWFSLSLYRCYRFSLRYAVMPKRKQNGLPQSETDSSALGSFLMKHRKTFILKLWYQQQKVIISEDMCFIWFGCFRWNFPS